MITLGSFPCLWRAPKAQAGPVPHRVAAHLPAAVRVDPHDAPAQRAAIAAMQGDWVLVMAADLLPYSTLVAMPAEPSLLTAGVAHRYLSRNVVTHGFDSANGPALWPRTVLAAAFEQGPELPQPDAVVPTVLALWHCNPDPKAAFLAGHETLRAAIADNLPGIELMASLGADAAHGHAWIAGGYTALLGEGAGAKANARLSDDPAGNESFARDLAREVRLAGRYDVQCLDPVQSRMLKQIVYQTPDALIFDRLADVLDRHGPQAQRRAGLYRAAAAWIWGEEGIDPAAYGVRAQPEQEPPAPRARTGTL